MLFTVSICYGKKGLRCYGSKMEIEILFFSLMWSKGEIIIMIHRLRIDNEFTEDPKLI